MTKFYSVCFPQLLSRTLSKLRHIFRRDKLDCSNNPPTHVIFQECEKQFRFFKAHLSDMKHLVLLLLCSPFSLPDNVCWWGEILSQECINLICSKNTASWNKLIWLNQPELTVQHDFTFRSGELSLASVLNYAEAKSFWKWLWSY